MSLADRILSEKRLTYQERKKLPSSAFAIPSQRKYPMQDKAHARNAKARAAQFASKSVEKKVDAKANKKLYGGRKPLNYNYNESAFTRGELLTEKHMGFKKLKASLAHKKHHPKNPGAVAAVIGREKYGKAKFQA